MYKMRPVRAGFVAFGEINTPRELIDSRADEAAKLLTDQGLELVTTASVSDDPAGSQADRAAQELSGAEMDLLIVCVIGWIPSWAIVRTIDSFRHLPVLVWGLSGRQQGNRFVTAAAQAGTTALRPALDSMGYTFRYIVTRRGQEDPIEEIMRYACAARAAKLLRTARIGMIGYRDMRLYGTLYESLSLRSDIGPEIEHFDLLEIKNYMDDVSDKEVQKVSRDVQKKWTFVKDPKPETIPQSARLYLALKRKLSEEKFDAFSYTDVDGIKKLLAFAPAGAMTMLHENMDICTVPENDSLGSVTQLMTRYLTGQVAAYLEFYEFMEDGGLMGVPDYVPPEIVDGNVTIMPNAFGDFGEGLLNVSRLKTGEVTLARLAYINDEYVLHLMTGQASAPVPWEEAGWAPPAPLLPSLDVVFDGDTDEFIQNVMSQHYIISYGDNSLLFEDLADILGLIVI